MNDFSIVIPFRHGAKYALSALLSCRLAARDVGAEVIICLDGPSSQEYSLLKRQIKRAGISVKLITSQGAGISAALNTGIQSASAPFVIRHDIDDIMMPGRLNYCAELFDAGAEFVFGSALRFPKPKRITVPQSIQAARRRSLHECPFVHPGSAFTKLALMRVGGYDSYFDGVEDFELWSRVLWSRCVMKTDSRLHVLYRQHRKQFTRTRDGHHTNLRRIEIFDRNRIATLNETA